MMLFTFKIPFPKESVVINVFILIVYILLSRYLPIMEIFYAIINFFFNIVSFITIVCRNAESKRLKNPLRRIIGTQVFILMR